MWEPATDIEQRMRDALRSGQQEEYFHTLARIDLLLPITEETSPSVTGSGSWATWATEERTHVLAFTSPEAMRLCLRSHAGNYRHVRFGALADAWPDPQWWLAVNPGTPIEGYLPSWFVGQVAAGDVRMPEQPRQQQPQQPDGWGGPPANAFNAGPGEPWGSDPTPPPYGDRPAPALGDNGLPRR
ncbi:MAG TPA: SseB family protein, partial [Stackebrandtia sp.]|uniref:SseB family protein n=1 Tax=Stackebrandtia sp. TaxID=2023065 RepID=UPI002D5CE016